MVAPSSSSTMAAQCSGALARPVDGFGHALAQVTVVVDAGEPQVGVGQPAQLADGVVGRAVARGDLIDEGAE